MAARSGYPRPRRGMTSGRKFSTRTSARATSFRKTSLPSGALRLRVTDFLLAFWARKLVPMRALLNLGTLPRTRARSPAFGFSILTTSAPRRARWSVQKGPERTLVRSRTRTPVRAPKGSPLGGRSREVGDGADLVDRSGHLPAEEAGHVPGHVHEGAQLDVGAEAIPVEGVDEVLGAGVAAGHPGERAAAEAGHRRLEALDAGTVGGVAVGEGEAVGVVEVAGPGG